MVTTLVRERSAVTSAREEFEMMYVLASADASVIGDYSRTHYDCLVSAVAASGVDIPEFVSLQNAVPGALGLLVIGDSREQIWVDLQTPCRFCGEGDRDGSTTGDQPKADS